MNSIRTYIAGLLLVSVCILFAQSAEAIVGIDRDFPLGIGQGVPNPSHIYKIDKQSDGKILMGGFFLGYDGIALNGIARLTDAGTLDTSYVAAMSKAVYDMVVLPDDSTVMVGEFCCAGTTNDTALPVRPNIVKFNADGTVDTSFVGQIGFTTPERAQHLNAIVRRPNGKMVIGGELYQYNGVPSWRIVQINPDGSRDPSFPVDFDGANGYVFDIALEADGSIIVVGDLYGAYDSEALHGIVRIGDKGDLDTGFLANISSGFDTAPLAVAIQSDGKMIVAGGFNTFKGQPAGKIVRLKPDGTRDSTFTASCQTGDTTSTKYIKALDIDVSGNILVGGIFTSCNGVPVSNFARLTSTGALDTTFPVTPPNFNKAVWDLFAESTQSVLGVGSFDYYGPFLVNRVARFVVDTTAPTITFTTPATYTTNAIPVTITITDDDQGSGITSLAGISVTSSLDGAITPLCTGVPSISSFPVVCTLTLVSPGIHALTVVATDASTNTATKISPSYGIDTTLPAITITAPTKESGAPIADTEILVMDTGGVGAITVTGGVFTCNFPLPTTETEVLCTGAIDTSGDIVVTATDQSGNIIVASELAYIIDTEPPVITFVSPVEGVYGEGQIMTFTVSDNRPFDAVNISVTGPEAYSVDCAPQTPVGSETIFECTFIANQADANISIDAFDAVGNPAVAIPLGHIIDTRPPALVSIVTTNPDGAYIAGTVIEIYALYDALLAPSSTLTLNLNNGKQVTLATVFENTISGVYTVESGDDVLVLDSESIDSQLIQNSAGAIATDTSIPDGAELRALHSLSIDTVAPSVVTQQVALGNWRLVFSEALASGTDAVAGSFSLVGGGLAITDIALDFAGDTLTLLSDSIIDELSLTLDYTASAEFLRDEAGNIAELFNFARPYTAPTPVDIVTSGGDVSTASKIKGCMDPLATNYNPRALLPLANACTYAVVGCMSPLALNFDPDATQNDASCVFNELPLPEITLVAGEQTTVPLVTSVAVDTSLEEVEGTSTVTETIKNTFDAFIDLITTIDNPLLPKILIPLFPIVDFAWKKGITLSDITALATLFSTLFLAMRYMTLPASQIVAAFWGPIKMLIPDSRRPWGRVFGTENGKPIKDARVSIYNQAKVLIASSRTNADGEYFFDVPPGMYTVDVVYPMYTFPADTHLAVLPEDMQESRELYYGKVVSVVRDRHPLFNIPITPTGQKGDGVLHIPPHIQQAMETQALFNKLVHILYWGGFSFALFSFVLFPSTYNTIILALYMMTLYIEIMGKRIQQKYLARKQEHTFKL